MSDAYQVVRDFEAALCEYAGAPYCVTTTSCTMALLLAVAWHLRNDMGAYLADGYGPMKEQRPKISIPKRTYIGVAMSIIHGGGWPAFRDEHWAGCYQLKPLPLWDSARWLYGDMYPDFGGMVCLSFHWSKTLAIGQGGAILHDDPVADVWLRKARFDGRSEGIDPSHDAFDVLGYHAYMMPRDAAEGLTRLALLPKHNAPLPWGPGTNSAYPDLSRINLFR